MKNRMVSGLLLSGALALAGLLWLAVGAQRRQYQDLNLVMPDGYGNVAYDLKKIETITREMAVITYEMKTTAEAQVRNISHAVTMIGTNADYKEVFGLQEVAGSFFTPAARTAGNHYAVLNEWAASRLFGGGDVVGNSLALDGRTYLVTGVVKDGNKKEAVVYVPAISSDGTVSRLIVKSADGLGAVRNSLIPLGVYESNSRVISLAAVSGTFRQQLAAALFLGIIMVIVYAVHRLMEWLRQHARRIGERKRELYPAQLMKASRRELVLIGCQMVLLFVYVRILTMLLRGLLKMALEYREVLRSFRYLSDYYFQNRIQWLVRWFYCGPVLLAVFLVVLLLLAAVLGSAASGK